MQDSLPIIYLSDEEYNLINNNRSIESVNTTISAELINKILNDNYYYSKIVSFFNSNKDKFGFIYKKNGKTEKIISLTKIDIVVALNNYLNELKNIPADLINKYLKLESVVSLPGLKKNYENFIYNVTIDNIDYKIPALTLIGLLERNDFIRIINNTDKINGIKKEHFLYAIRNFIIDEKINRNYKMPNIIRSNYSYILNDVDLEAVNRFTETIDTTHQLIEVDKDLEQEILSSIPNDLSNLEKSIYLYIKMCKLFSYDEEIYVNNQKGETLKKHQDYHYIKNINLHNRELVCFEFNTLYCYFLNKLGLNFKINHMNHEDDSYGMGHENVEYRCDKYLVNADSTLNIIYSDLYYAKFNKRLEGIKCLNINKKSQSEFKDALNKVYSRIYGNEEKFVDLSRQASYIRLKYLFDAYGKLPKDNLNTMDGISYFIDLYRTIFDANERKNNIKVTFVRIGSKINIIVTVNELGVNYIDDNTYYLIVPNQSIQEVNLADLQNMFDEGIYSYVNEKRDKIPGIHEEHVRRI